MNANTFSLLKRICRRHISTVKRKYPVNPDDAKELPVFQYPVSKPSYNRVFVFGNALTGALGIPYLKHKENTNRVESYRSPKRLGFAEKFQVTHVACGFGFTTFAVNSDTAVKVYGTGINSDSQIGYHAIRKGKPLEIIFFPQPIHLPIANPKKTKVLKLAAGRAHLLVLTDEGLFTLGNNAYGQCGRKVVETEDYSAHSFVHHVKNVDGKKIVDVECGQDHSLLLTNDGCVYSCGWGADGQTGLGHFQSTDRFTQVQGDILGEKIKRISSRSDFVLALNDKGDVFGWGNAEYSQITLAENVQQLAVAKHMKALGKIGAVKDIGAGGAFCVAVTEKNEVYTWGCGLLGTGPEVQSSKDPIHIPPTLFGRNDFQPDNLATSVSCGISHAVVSTSLGDLYAWGRNRSGCLGLGHEKDQYFPFKVSLGGFAQFVSCGFDHTVAMCKPYI